MKPTYQNILILTLLAVLGATIAENLRAVLALPDLHKILWPANDSDDWLRLVQVRDWLQGGDFHERLVYHTNAPFGGMPRYWTRLMDILLAPAALLLPASFSLDQRIMISAALVPPLLGVVSFVALLWGARRAVPGRQAFFLLTALFLLGTSLRYHFASGSADHHALQIMLWCMIVALCGTIPAPRASFLIGLLLALELWVSVEAVFIVAAVYSLFGIAALRRPSLMRSMGVMCAAAAFFSGCALLAEIPAANVLSYIKYDTISIVHVVLLSFVAAATFVLIPVFEAQETWKKRALSAALAAMAVLGGLLLTFPKFLKGPMVDADPFIQQGLFDVIEDAVPFFMASAQNIFWIITQPLIAVFVLAVCLCRKRKKWLDIAMLFLMAVSCTLMLIQARWFYYVLPVSVFILLTRVPPVVRLYSRRLRFLRDFSGVERAIGLVFLLTLLTAGIYKTIPVQPPKDSGYCYTEMAYLLQNGGVERALGEKPLTLFINPTEGGLVQFFTLYHVIAGYYHREGAGLRDLHAIATASTPTIARRLLKKRKVDALLICASDYKPGSWLATLPKGLPVWLRAVPLEKTSLPGEKPMLLSVGSR